MPKVASDPIVPRPLRPEPVSGRAGAPTASGSFEVLLDTGPAERTSERRARTGPADDRNAPRTDMRRPRNSIARAGTAADGNATKPADTPRTRPAKNSQPIANEAEPGSQNAPVIAEEFAAIAQAVNVKTEGKATPAAEDADTATMTSDEVPETIEGASIVALPAAPAAEVTAPVAVALPAPATPLPAASPAVDPAGITPVTPQSAAPATPAAAAPIDAQAQAAAAPATDADGAAPAKPQAAADASTAAPKATPGDESQKAAALKSAGFTEAPETKTRADRDNPGKVKPDQHGGIARTANASPAVVAPAADAPLEQQATEPGIRPPQDHTTPAARPAPVDARTDATVTNGPAQGAASQASASQPNGSIPVVPFNLAAAAAQPLPAMWPVTALRVDTAGAVPVAGLAVEIVARAQDGSRRFEIRLDPPELGRIDVRLDVDQAGKVTSRLVVERAETLDLLRRDAPSLERALQHAGLNTEGGLEFSLRDQNFANRDQAPRGGAAVTQVIIPDDEAAAAEAARRGYGRLIGLGSGVDIRV